MVFTDGEHRQGAAERQANTARATATEATDQRTTDDTDYGATD